MFFRQAGVAVAGGLGDHGTTRIDARTLGFAGSDGGFERKRGAAQVTARGETALQHGIRFTGALGGEGLLRGVGIEHFQLGTERFTRLRLWQDQGADLVEALG